MSSLTIAFVPGVSPAKWARVWRDRHPDIELLLRPIGPDGVDAALEGDADMVFARLPVGDAHHAIPLWTETPVVAGPKESIIAAADDLVAADLTGETVLVDGLGTNGPVAVSVPQDLDALLDLVEAGVGYAVLPQSLFRAASRKKLVARAITDVEPTRVALAWREADASELTEEFIGIVRGRTANSSRGTETPPTPPAPKKRPAQPTKKQTARPGRTRPRRGGGKRTR
jgi:DNA-binding transcriptional LysR family regulator